MARTKFTQDGNSVTVECDDRMGGRETTEYFVPMNGGYVRIRDKAGANPQVCEGLSGRGSTLTATPETLLAVIRREDRRGRRHEQRMRDAW